MAVKPETLIDAGHLLVFQASQHIYNLVRAVPHCRYVVLFDWVSS